MPTDTQRSRLRLDTGHSEATLPDYDVDDIFTRAAEEYSASAVEAGARVITIQYLLSNAAKLHDYTQNNTDEKASQVFANLKDLRDEWQTKADEATKADNGGGVLSGRTRRIPRRIKAFPG